MLGAFLAFGVDTIVIVGGLWYVNRLPGSTAVSVSVAILLVFALWIFGRWVRLRRMDHSERTDSETEDSRQRRNPLERLKQQYAEGEISDDEFEKRLDTLLDADRRAESADDTSPERFECLREEE
jgi:uncharacterized membrane protein